MKCQPQDGWKHFEGLLPTHHGFHQPKGDDDRSEGKNSADHGVEIRFRQGRYRCQGMDWRTDGSPSHRRSVGDQIQRSGMKRLKAQSDHEGASDRHRRAEPRRTFNECSKTKSNQQDLQPAVRSNSGYRLFHDLKLPGLDRDVIEVYRRQNNPGYFQYAEGNPISKADCSQSGRHLEKNDRNGYRRGGAGDGAPMRLNSESGQQPEENDDGKSRNHCGQPPMTEWIVDLGPLHDNLRMLRQDFPWEYCTECTSPGTRIASRSHAIATIHLGDNTLPSAEPQLAILRQNCSDSVVKLGVHSLFPLTDASACVRLIGLARAVESPGAFPRGNPIFENL